MFQSLTTVNGTVMVNLLNPWGSYEPAPVPFAKVGSLFNAIEFDQFTRAGVNLGPILVRQTAGQTWTQGSHVSLALGADVFIEASGKTLSYAAAQANGQALPSWLTFNAATTTFSGTVPGWMQTLSLKVTATDTSALSCSETFQAASDGSGFAATDMSAGAPVSDSPQAYSGPVPGLQSEYISITADNLNISVSTPNWFIHSGSGDDAIAVNGGTNVLDGGTGSNFLTGGSGTDTFFVDDGGPTADIWSTVVGFHAGDAATIWGVTPQDFSISWMDGQGATGCTGLTLHAAAAGRPTASLTLAGFSQADMRSGRLSVGFGSDPASGSAYMYVHGNS